MAAESEWIRNATSESFQQDVLELSQTVPVVVDFWAEWCGPCRQLAPALEALATSYGGRFVLVKINVDESPEVAQAFGVQSIPFVVGMVDGQPVNHFQGVLPEDQLKQWIDGILPSPAGEAFAAGQALEAEGDVAGAAEKYREAVSLDDSDPAVRIALARTLLAIDNDLECQEVIQVLEARGFLEPEAEHIKQQLEIKAQVEESGGVQEARAASEADPKNDALKLKLAEALGADKRYEEACELCLELIQRDRDGVGADAKETMVRTLELMGSKSALASSMRRRLATAFY